MSETAASSLEEAPRHSLRPERTTHPVPAEFAALASWLDAYREDLEHADTLVDCLPLLADRVERLALAAEEAALPGLQDSALFYSQHLMDASASNPVLATAGGRDLIRAWPERVATYLAKRSDESATALIDYLADPSWPHPLSRDDAAVLSELFGLSEERIEEDPTGACKWCPPLAERPAEIGAELFAMLAAEVPRLRERLGASESDSQQPSQLCRQIERFGNAAETASLTGLSGCAAFVADNLRSEAKRATECIAAWLDAVDEYLTQTDYVPSTERVLGVLHNPAWPIEWRVEQDAPMRALLQNVTRLNQTPPATGPERIDHDTSLEVPPDISPELLDGLLQELPQQTTRLTAAVQAACGRQGRESLEDAQRVAHTIKGAAMTVGVKGVANLTHRVEDVLLYLRDQHIDLDTELQGVLLEACDCLEEMGEALLGIGEPPAAAAEVLRTVTAWIGRLRDAPERAPAEPERDPEQRVLPRTEADQPQTERPSGMESENLLRVPAAAIDELLRGVGETIILGSQLQDRAARAVELNRQLALRTDYLRDVMGELDRAIERQGALGDEPAGDHAMDALELERFNELHTISHRLLEAAADSQEMSKGIAGQLRELNELLIGQQRLNRETQYLGMRSRMLPIKTIVPRLQRVVRQTARSTGKSVGFAISGEETLLDNGVLNALVDPLMHMLRNAVDHGIEPVAEREARGKDPEGRIAIDCQRQGNQIVIRCSDDGAGLDLELVRRKGIERGLLQPETDYSAADISALIFVAGFSTRSAASQISGRGVGLDIVSSALSRINGTVHVEGNPDGGCVFELRVPISLISVQVLLAMIRGKPIALVTHNIEQVLHPDSGDVEAEGKSFCYEDESLPVYPLEELLGLGPDRRGNSRQTRPLLLVGDGDRRCVVSVEQLRQRVDVVVKGLGRYLPDVAGTLGATILGDGAIAPVVDPADLLRHERRGQVPGRVAFGADTELQELPTALIVDDSVSARRTLAQAVMDMGIRVRTAKDGLEAVTLIEQQRPHLLLVDLEMPRMNGLELAAHMRSSTVTAGLPIIMITSRSTDKHRRLAEAAGVDVYLTKPYTDDILFDHVTKLLAASKGERELPA